MNLMIIEQASLIGVLRILLIIVLVYYGLRVLARYVFPFLIRKYVKKQQQKFYDQQQQHGSRHSFNEQEQEGEVKIKYKPKSSVKGDSGKQKNDEDAGEYVDFEEID